MKNALEIAKQLFEESVRISNIIMEKKALLAKGVAKREEILREVEELEKKLQKNQKQIQELRQKS